MIFSRVPKMMENANSFFLQDSYRMSPREIQSFHRSYFSRILRDYLFSTTGVLTICTPQFPDFFVFPQPQTNKNKPETAQVGAISEAQKYHKDFKVPRKRYMRTLKTLYPNFENLISELRGRYIETLKTFYPNFENVFLEKNCKVLEKTQNGDVVWSPFYFWKRKRETLYPEFIISGLRLIGFAPKKLNGTLL